jgi:TolB-like protein/Flp pilus assembly protein TadD
LQQQRHRIDTAAATVLGRGAEQADKNGNGPLAIHFAERLSALDPARGSAHRLLLRLSASHRGRDDAMARADSLDKTLRAEFGVGVDTETRALIAEIKAGEFEVNPAGPPRLSILVLPFANIGGAPEQEYFADGVTESLTTDLSRMRGMMVIGRSTAFTYKAKRVDLKQVGRELGVRYVLEGSVQRSGDRMRVNAQLIDVETGKQVWAERFDKNLTGLFDMQDEIVARLANQLGTQMITAEARRAERSPAPDSLDLFFQGMACISRGMTPEYLTQANGYFTRALLLDPGNIEALVYRAYVDTLRVSSYAVDDRAAPIAAAEAALSKALSIVPDHAYAHGFLGYAQIQSKRPIQGIAHCERALELDRNLASAHAVIGLGKSYIGRGEETEAHVLEAMRLSPRDMFASNWLWIAGVAKLYLRQSAEAVVLLQQSIELNRNNVITHIMIASALAHLGRLNEAQLAIKAALGIAPNFNIRRWSEGPYSDHPSYMEQRGWVAEGLRTAGLPE